MKLFKPAVVAAAVAVTICGCGQKAETPSTAPATPTAPAPKQITIGISYQNLQNEFIINIQDAVRAEAKKLNVNLIESDGQGNAENQISQVQDFLAQNVDAIILNPYDREGSAPAVNLAVKAHKPIVVVNAIVSNLDKANAYVGSEDAEAGRIEAQRIADVLNGKGNVVIIHGPNGHSAEVQRSEGIRDVLAKYPNIKVIAEQTANWDRTQALNLMQNWLASGQKIDAVIAQNDEMALGALKAIEETGKQGQIAVIGIDAIPDALKAVSEGKMVGTVFQDAKGQGSLAVELAVDLAQGKSVKHDNYIPFQLVTTTNVSQFVKAN
ncbi:MAG TPA: sugar ABC transporter substrate-binding protein [Candidatus Sulfotelmatobacter sp.]|nr:sugar ABC transporter substrate-binding protein [Candidatus Sulfotelmatobacter sp.]